jgi:hypothetical protein
MPYRLRGKVIEVKRTSGWVPFKAHRSKELAQKHLRALNQNVRHMRPRKRR